MTTDFILIRLYSQEIKPNFKLCQNSDADPYLLFRWNQLDVAIVFLSVVGIVLEEMKGQVTDTVEDSKGINRLFSVSLMMQMKKKRFPRTH